MTNLGRSDVDLMLVEATAIADRAIFEARMLDLRPVCVAVLERGGYVKVVKCEDGASILRPEIAIAKAWGAIAMESSTREIADRFKDRPEFLGALSDLCGGKIIPVPGGLPLFRGRRIVGAIGVSGASSEEDEACAKAAILAARQYGLFTQEH